MSRLPSDFGMSRPWERDVESRAGSSVLVSFFNQVYAWMAAGLAMTAMVAWWAASSGMVLRMGPGTLVILFVAELAMVIAISGAIQRIDSTIATGLFLLYSALNGLTLAGIFLVYTHASLASTFIVTAGTFAAMSVYGMVTRSDLSRWGNILFMALVGFLIASLVNLFLHSPAFYWLLTYAGILIFVGLTAYDTQRLKEMAYQVSGNGELTARIAIVGSLQLYLDFVNLFLLLLRLLGDRK